LAGVTTQALFFEGPPANRRLCFRVAVVLGILAILAPAGVAVGRSLLNEPIRFAGYWVFMLIFFVAALWLLRLNPVGQASRLPGGGRRDACPTGPALLWGGLLLADLWALTWPLVE